MRYSDAEYAVIVSAAELDGMRPTSWAQNAAYQAAVRRCRNSTEADPVAASALLEELRQQRRVLTNVGGNLNDLARVANSTGAVGQGAALAVVLRLVARVVRSCDEAIRRVRAELPR